MLWTSESCLKVEAASIHIGLSSTNAWKIVHLKCFMMEIKDLDTFEVEGIVRTKVGYNPFLLDTVDSLHLWQI